MIRHGVPSFLGLCGCSTVMFQPSGLYCSGSDRGLFGGFWLGDPRRSSITSRSRVGCCSEACAGACGGSSRSNARACSEACIRAFGGIRSGPSSEGPKSDVSEAWYRGFLG